MGTPYRLDHGEAFNAAIAGLQRQFRAIGRGATDNNGDITRDEIATHIHGAIAEVTVAKALGLYCNVASPDRSIADVGQSIEVRSTPYDNGSMPIRRRDKDNAKYYLVAGIYPHTKIIGWIYGRDAKQPKFWVDTDKDGNKISNPYWKVPQSALNQELIEVTA